MLSAVTKWSGRLADFPLTTDVVLAALDLAGPRPAGAVHLDYDPNGLEVPAPAPTAPSPVGSTDDVVDWPPMVRTPSRSVAIVGVEAVELCD